MPRTIVLRPDRHRLIMSLLPLKRSATRQPKKRLRKRLKQRARQALLKARNNNGSENPKNKEYQMREKKSKAQTRADKQAKEQNRAKSQQQKTAKTWGIGIAIVSILLVLSMVLSSVRF